MENRAIAISIHQLSGIGSATLHQIHQWMDRDWGRLREDFPSLDFYRLGLSEEMVRELQDQIDPFKVEEVKRNLEKLKISTVMYGEEGYPEQLAEIPTPPFLLYGIGDMSLLQSNSIGIVGTRVPSSYGQLVTNKLSADLAEVGWTVVSGLAKGIDTYAHRGALSVKGKTIAVLGCGVDVVYPKENRRLYEEIYTNDGLIISEYPPGQPPTRGLFPQRNRIISGISRGVVVVECHHKSGSLITANWALEQGREVFAVPGSILSAKSSGPHNLIKEGAKLVTSAQDILEEFSYLRLTPLSNGLKETESDTLIKEEQKLFDLISYTQIHIDEILLSSNMQRGDIHRHLLSLEMKKYIKKLPGFYYIRTR